MISPVLAALLLAAPSPAAVAQARLVYSKCLTAALKTDLKEKVEPAAFDAKLATLCKPEEIAFRGALVSLDVANRTARAAAEAGAADEVSYFHDTTKERYKDFFETNTIPR